MNTRLKMLLFGRFSWKRLVRSLLLMYIILTCAAFFLSDFLIFRPQPSSYSDVSSSLIISGDDDTVIARYYKHPTSKVTVLYSHGNAEDLGIMEEFLELYQRKGFSIFAYDYLGYGKSSGKASTKRAYHSAEMAYKYMTTVLKIPAGSIVVHGQSVGGGLATYIADKYPVGGLILESTFVTAYRALTVVPIFPFDKLNNLARIENINCPLLVIHGTHDLTIDDWNGKALYDKGNEPKSYVALEGANHNMIPYPAQEVYWKSIGEFVMRLKME